MALLAALLGSAPAAAQAGAGFCPPDRSPAFTLGLADLAQLVGEPMGQPLECEHATDAAGSTAQRTTTGVAFYSPASGEVSFTDGYRRWSLGPNGPLYQPAPDAPTQPLIHEDPSAMLPWVRPVVCPVLYTHEVPSPAVFRRMLNGLLGAGYRPTSLASVDAALAGQADPPRGCLVLSFDDALASQYQNALPVLNELGLPAVFFVLPDFADGVHRYQTEAQLKALHDAGHEVEAHTCHHPPSLPLLARLNFAAFMAELVDCKARLEAIVGAPVAYLAYPSGLVDATVVAGAGQAGYRAAFTTRPAALLRPDQPYLLPRIRYDSGENPAAVVRRIRAAGG